MTNGWNTKKGAIIRRSSRGGAVHWCVGATLLMLAALAFVTPAQALAQTSDVLASNLGQAEERPARPDLENDLAQIFTTGIEPLGYKLTSVDVSINAVDRTNIGGCAHTVEVYTANDLRPTGTRVGSLSQGVTNSGDTQTNYTASGDGIDLDPSANYAIVVDSTVVCENTDISVTRSTSVDASSEAGWSFHTRGAHERAATSTSAGAWGTFSPTKSLKIAINGYVNTANAAPSASDGKVTTTEDTEYTFTAANFNFSDTDTDDTLESVVFVTLPGSGKGTLALSGTAVSAGASVSRADIDAGNLKYTPPANSNGDAFASFTFKVSDGKSESVGGYNMTIDVTAVNDDPTGAPAIVGDAIAGVTLTLDLSAIMDVDGLPAPSGFEINWYRTDNDTNSIANTMTYELNVNNIGKNLSVVVGFTDLGGEEEEVVLQMWPETGTIAPALTLSVAPTTIYEDPGTATVTIDTQGGVTHDAARTITLTLAGTATEGTDYSIASKTLTLAANTASVTTTITAMTDSATEGDETVLVTATTGMTTIGSETVTIKDPSALTVSMPPEFGSGSFLVEGASVDVPVLLSGAPGRAVTITMEVRRRRDTSSSDYTTSPLTLTFGPTETRKTVTVTATDDSETDPGESLSLDIPGAADLPAGITESGESAQIYIVDNDFEYQVSHAGGPTLAEDEDGGTLTAMVRVRTPGGLTASALAALNETVTLTVSTADGTATAGQDYTALSAQTLTFARSDFAIERFDCVPSSANCAQAEKTVTVPITDDMVHEGATPETFTLTLSHGSDQRVTLPLRGERHGVDHRRRPARTDLLGCARDDPGGRRHGHGDPGRVQLPRRGRDHRPVAGRHGHREHGLHHRFKVAHAAGKLYLGDRHRHGHRGLARRQQRDG